MELTLAVANYFIGKTIEEDKRINLITLNNLVFSAHQEFLYYWDIPLIGEPVYCWKDGPAIQSIFYSIPRKQRNFLISKKYDCISEHEETFDRMTTKFLDRFWNTKKDFTYEDFNLHLISEFSAWNKIAKNHTYKDRYYQIIPNNLIKECYGD